MSSFESLKADLRDLSRSGAIVSVTLGDDFFAAVEAKDMAGGRVDVELKVEGPVGGIYEVRYRIDGIVRVTCDRCLALMDQPIEAEGIWAAQVGGTAPEDSDILIANDDDGVLDLSWLVYEQVALAMPLRHVHPDGECDSDMAERLRGMAVDMAPESETTEPATTWKGLEKLKTIIKD